MEWHVRTLAKLHVVTGAICFLAASYLAVQLSPLRSGLPPINGDPVMGFLGLVVIAVVIVDLLLFLASGLLVTSGIGLLRRQSWAQYLAVALSILMTPLFPIGTALAIYGLWVIPDLNGRSTPAPASAVPEWPLNQ